MTRNALIAILFWSLSAPIALLGASSTNLSFSILALFGGALLFWSVTDPAFWKRSLKTLRQMRRQTPIAMVLFVAGLSIYYFTWYFSLYQYAPAQALIINYMWPLLLYFTQMFVFSDQSNRPVFDPLILSLAFIGVFFLVFEGSPTQTDTPWHSHVPYQFAFVAAVLPSAYMNAGRHIVEVNEIDPTHMYQAAAVVSFPVLAGLALLSLLIGYSIPTPTDLFPAALMGVTSVAIAHTAFNKAMDGTNNAFLSSAAFLSPILAVVILALFYGQSLSSQIVFGISLILVANVLTSRLLDRHISAVATALGVFYVLAGASFRKFIGTAQFDGDLLQGILAVFTLLAGFMVSQIMTRRKTQIEDLDRFAGVSARIRLQLANRPELRDEFDRSISRFIARLCQGTSSSALHAKPEARIISELAETLGTQCENNPRLKDISDELFNIGLSLSAHHRGYYSKFEVLLLTLLGIGLSTATVATMPQAGLGLTATATLACGLSYLLGKLFELNDFFHLTLATKEQHFNAILFDRTPTYILFRNNRAPQNIQAPHRQLLFDGERISSDQSLAFERRSLFDTRGRMIVVSILLASVIVQIATIAIAGF